MAANETRPDANSEVTEVAAKRPKVSLDTWAVIFALAAAALIRSGAIKHIPW